MSLGQRQTRSDKAFSARACGDPPWYWWLPAAPGGHTCEPL